MRMKIHFPGKLAVQADYKGMTIATDQPAEYGGDGAAPAPFDLFLASIGTCAGFYALRFCQERNLSTKGLGLDLVTELDPATRKIASVRLELQLPEEFPEKYRDAILRSIDQCAVKRHLDAPPRFEMAVIEPAWAVEAASAWS